MIVQTVALPVYNSSRIAWLAMEGLCHQEVSHGWELIICEEKHAQQLGEEFFLNYKDRLPGCERLLYIELPQWVPLGRKWKIMGEQCDPNSKSFLLQAADDYSGAKRLQMTHDIIATGVDWVDFTKAYFYSFRDNILRLYSFRGKRNPTIGINSDFAREIPENELKCGVDTFLVESMKMWNPGAKICHSDYLFSDARFTSGYNTISQARNALLRQAKRPFRRTKETIYTIPIPDDIRSRILDMYISPPRISCGQKPQDKATRTAQWKKRFP